MARRRPKWNWKKFAHMTGGAALGGAAVDVLSGGATGGAAAALGAAGAAVAYTGEWVLGQIFGDPDEPDYG